MWTEEEQKERKSMYEAAMRAELNHIQKDSKGHVKIKSSKGKFKSNMQPPKKKRKRKNK